MKRVFSIVLLLCVLLCGCKSTQQPAATTPPPESNFPEVTTESLQPEYHYTQQPMLCVSVPVNTQYAYDEYNQHIFTYTTQGIALVVDEPEIADKIIIDFLGRTAKHDKQSQTIFELAEQELPVGTPYGYEFRYSPMRIDQNVLSFYGSIISYAGGIHPDHGCTAANYSMVTGDVLTLGSILSNVDAIEPLYQLLLENLQQNKDSLHLIPGYDEIVFDCLFFDESYNEAWYFSSNGLCFFFPPYEIAPYSTGIVVVEIPYEKLTGIIADDFFPPETSTADGTVCAIRFQDTDLTNFTQIAEVILDPAGETFFLYTEQMVYDARLEVGSWDETGTQFTPSYTAFVAHTLSPGDAAMIQAYFSDVMPTLRLTYLSGNESKCFYIHQSGKDGSIYLTEK